MAVERSTPIPAAADLLADYQLLSAAGHIGYYQRASVVQVFLVKADLRILLLFTLVVMESEMLEKSVLEYIGKPFFIEGFQIGIRTFELSVEAVDAAYRELLEGQRWSPHNEANTLDLPTLVPLRRHYVPPLTRARVSGVLKNNFFQGSYLLEFFDESKANFGFLDQIGDGKWLAAVSVKLEERLPLKLQLNQDRLGSILFQFPINVLATQFWMEYQQNRYRIRFTWHPSIGPAGKPLTVVTRSATDRSIINYAITPHNRASDLVIPYLDIDRDGQLDIVDDTTGLLLGQLVHGPSPALALLLTLNEETPRVFYIDEQQQRVTLKQVGSPQFPDQDYKQRINAGAYLVEKKELIRKLDFKQYFEGMEEEALKDLRNLIATSDGQGVYLWDPYLRATDLLHTLYHSPTGNVPLRAICSLSSKKKRDDGSEDTLTQQALLEQQRQQLAAPRHNNHLLNLEFRAQYGPYGYGFHDRFLLFPGYNKQPARVYSLGTSVNGFGKSHHILQAVAHPQPIIDAFDALWNRLNDPNCLIWKS
jgi:hypothetical protein